MLDPWSLDLCLAPKLGHLWTENRGAPKTQIQRPRIQRPILSPLTFFRKPFSKVFLLLWGDLVQTPPPGFLYQGLAAILSESALDQNGPKWSNRPFWSKWPYSEVDFSICEAKMDQNGPFWTKMVRILAFARPKWDHFWSILARRGPFWSIQVRQPYSGHS